MSIFELFKKRRREEPEEQEQPEQPKNTGAIPTPNEKSATVKSSKPPEKPLSSDTPDSTATLFTP